MRNLNLAVAALAVLSLAACGDDGSAPILPSFNVVGHVPEDGATHVALTAVISVTFSDQVNPTTITNTSFTLTGPAGAVPGTVSVSSGTATFTAAAPLAGLARYTAAVSTDARDMAGHPLRERHFWTFTTQQTPLLRVIGDIEWSGCAVTLPGANSIYVAGWLGPTVADTFPDLVDTTGAVTPLSFAFDVGGGGVTIMSCQGQFGPLEREAIGGAGSGFIKPWHIAGLNPGGTYEMTFTGGTATVYGMRIFLDANGDGTIAPAEVDDLIGATGVETRAFPWLITAGQDGTIRGEFWGGSTTPANVYVSTWRGWSIIGRPQP